MVSKPLRIGTLNVRGLGSSRKQAQLQTFLRRQNIDVFAVQETKLSTDEATAAALSQFTDEYDVIVSHAVRSSCGCFLLLKRSRGFTIDCYVVDSAGRFIVADVAVGNASYRVVVLYAPNVAAQRTLVFEEIRGYLRTTLQVLLLGDFNCVCSMSDRSGDQVMNDPSAIVLESLLQEFDLVDGGKACGSYGLKYTHFQGASHARLDRIYVPGGLRRSLWNYTVTPAVFTDHCLVCITIGDNGRPGASSFVRWELWKFNVRLLADEVFQADMCALLSQSFLHVGSWAVAWDSFKLRVRECAIVRSSAISYEARREQRDLLKRLHGLLRLECDCHWH